MAHKHREGPFVEDQNLPPTPGARKQQLAQWQAQKHTSMKERATTGKESTLAGTKESVQPLHANPLLVNSESGSTPQVAKYLKNASARPSNILSPVRLQRTPSKVFTPKAIRVPVAPQNETPKPARVPLLKAPTPHKACKTPVSFGHTKRELQAGVTGPGPLDAIATRVAVLKSSLTPRKNESEAPKVGSRKEELQASYWLRRIREAETLGNHGTVISLFEQAVESGAQSAIDLIRGLQNYRAKHVSSRTTKAKQPGATPSKRQTFKPEASAHPTPTAPQALGKKRAEKETAQTDAALEETETASKPTESEQTAEDPTESVPNEVELSSEGERAPLTSPVKTVAVTPLSSSTAGRKMGFESPMANFHKASKKAKLQDFEVILTPLRSDGPKQARQQHSKGTAAVEEFAQIPPENGLAALSTPLVPYAADESPPSTPATGKMEELLPATPSPPHAPNSPTVLLPQTWANPDALATDTPELRNSRTPRGASPASFLRLPQTPGPKTPPADVMLIPASRTPLLSTPVGSAGLVPTTPLLCMAAAPADVMLTPAVTPTSWQPEEAQPQPGSGPGQSTPTAIQMPSVQRSASRVTPDVIRTPGLSRRLNLDAEESKVRTPLSRFALRSPLGSARRVALTPEAAPAARVESGVKTGVADFPVVLNGRKNLKPSPLNLQSASKKLPSPPKKGSPLQMKQSQEASPEAQAMFDKSADSDRVNSNPPLAPATNPQAEESAAVSGFVRMFACVANETVSQQDSKQPQEVKSSPPSVGGKEGGRSSRATPNAGAITSPAESGKGSIGLGKSPKVGAAKEIERWLKRAHGKQSPSAASISGGKNGELLFLDAEDSVKQGQKKEATPSTDAMKGPATLVEDDAPTRARVSRATRTASVKTPTSGKAAESESACGVNAPRSAGGGRTPVSGAQGVNKPSSSLKAAVRVNTPPETAPTSASKRTPLLHQERTRLRRLVIDNSARTPEASGRKQRGQPSDNLLQTPTDKERSSSAPENMTPGAASASDWAAAADAIRQKHASTVEDHAAFGSPVSAPSGTPVKEPTFSCKTPTFTCTSGEENATSSPDTPPSLPELTPREVDMPTLRASPYHESPRVITLARQLSARFTPSRLSRPSPAIQQETTRLMTNPENKSTPAGFGLTANRGAKLLSSVLGSPAQRTPGKSAAKTGTRELRQLGGRPATLGQGASPSSSTTILTPVRANKQARQALGAEHFVLSPVRRSSRRPSELRQSSSEVLEMLETTGFTYTPNKALAAAPSAHRTPAARRMAELTRGNTPAELAAMDVEGAATYSQPDDGTCQETAAKPEKDVLMRTEAAEECETAVIEEEDKVTRVQVEESPEESPAVAESPQAAVKAVPVHTVLSEPEAGDGENASKGQCAAPLHTLRATRRSVAGAAVVAPSAGEGVNEPTKEVEGRLYTTRGARKLPATGESLAEGLQVNQGRAARKCTTVSEHTRKEATHSKLEEQLDADSLRDTEEKTADKKTRSNRTQVTVTSKNGLQEKTKSTRHRKSASQEGKARAQEERLHLEMAKIEDQPETDKANSPLKKVSFDPSVNPELTADGNEGRPTSKARERAVRKTAGKASDVSKELSNVSKELSSVSEGLSDGVSERSTEEQKKTIGRATRRAWKIKAKETGNGTKFDKDEDVDRRVTTQNFKKVERAVVVEESVAAVEEVEMEAVTSAKRTRGRQAVDTASVIEKKMSRRKSAASKASGYNDGMKESKVGDDQRQSREKRERRDLSIRTGVDVRRTEQRSGKAVSEAVVGRSRRAVLKDNTNAQNAPSAAEKASARGSKSAKQSEHLTPEKESGAGKDESIAVGTRIQIWWPDDKRYYSGVVTAYRARIGKHKVEYDDGDSEEVVLSKETWRVEESRRVGRA